MSCIFCMSKNSHTDRRGLRSLPFRIFCTSKNSHTDRRGLRSLPFLHFLHVQE
mgnify:FL=1